MVKAIQRDWKALIYQQHFHRLPCRLIWVNNSRPTSNSHLLTRMEDTTIITTVITWTAIPLMLSTTLRSDLNHHSHTRRQCRQLAVCQTAQNHREIEIHWITRTINYQIRLVNSFCLFIMLCNIFFNIFKAIQIIGVI